MVCSLVVLIPINLPSKRSKILRQVKNSWGASWGENGYIRLERGVPGDGECGIKDQPSYPLVKAKTETELVV